MDNQLRVKIRANKSLVTGYSERVTSLEERVNDLENRNRER